MSSGVHPEGLVVGQSYPQGDGSERKFSKFADNTNLEQLLTLAREEQRSMTLIKSGWWSGTISKPGCQAKTQWADFLCKRAYSKLQQNSAVFYFQNFLRYYN